MSLFIIIGLLIVLLFSFSFFFSSINKTRNSAKNMVDEDSLTKYQVSYIVESCTRTLLKEALINLGRNGGYIKIGENKHINIPSTEATPAIWLYMKDRSCISNCYYYLNIPALKKENGNNSIQEQLENYLNSKILSCVSNPFLSIKKAKIKVNKKPKARIYIANDFILCDVYMPLFINGTRGSFTLKRFKIKELVKLGESYFALKAIVKDLAKTGYLEELTKELVFIYSDTSKNKLPPFYSLLINEHKNIIWDLKDVKEKLRSILSSYIPAIALSFNQRQYPKNTKITKESKRSSGSHDSNLIKNLLIHNIKSTYSHPKLEFSFSYFGFPIYLKISPSNGDIIKASNLAEIPMFGILDLFIEEYKFNYDISYPVIISSYDPYAFKGKGFIFNIGYEVNLRSNKQAYKKRNLFISKTPNKLNLCNLKKAAGPLKIRVSGYSEDLDNVSIYVSSDTSFCYLGKTKSGTLKTMAPVCYGCKLEFRKNGYLALATPIFTEIGKTKNIDVKMMPIKKINVTVLKLLPNQSFAQKLEANESAIVYFFRINKKTSFDESEFLQAAEIKSNKSRQISLVPGNYGITATIIHDSKIELSEYKINQDLRLPEKDINGYIIGLFEANETKPKKIGAKELYRSNRLEIIVPAIETPESWESLINTSKKLMQNKNSGYLIFS